ncbi:MAG: hypothetical protein QF893_00950 [Alphaproteobacteria bacterium]|jgi:hypothetical protein|nr:hypothetical protein [Alphaproteobacteria bacterium]
MSRTTQALAATALAVIVIVSIAGTAYAQSGIARLGHRWDVEHSNGWKGIWTRRDIRGAISNQYDAVWFHPVHGEFRSDIRIHISVRDELIIQRKDITGLQAGKTCRYTGRLNFAARTARGTSTCVFAPGNHPWWAKIWR